MSRDERTYREQVAWMEKHNGADVLVCDTRTKECTEAIYYSPQKKMQDARDEYARRFFQLVREAEQEKGSVHPPQGGSISHLAEPGNQGVAAFRCKAQRTADPPQDCDWPTCGCDPYADKVIAALQESGKL